MSYDNFSIKMSMFTRFSFDIYKPNTEAMLVLLQSDDADLDIHRMVKWNKIKKTFKNILSVILFVWNCSSSGYKTKPDLLKWEIN